MCALHSTDLTPRRRYGFKEADIGGMVQSRVAKKLLKVTFEEFLRRPFFALGPRFHENCDILEVVYYNVKFLY